MFLNTEVLQRGLRTSRFLRDRKSESGQDIIQTLSVGTVDGYVSAVVALYNFQFSSGYNTHPHPRGAKLKAVMKDRTRKEHVRRKAEYADRGANTLQDRYEEEEMMNVVRSCWTWGRAENSQRRALPITIESAHRTALDFLMGHMMLLRGENRRTMQLPDLFPLPLQNEGPTACTAQICILDNGKMNKSGRIEYGGVVRHKNVLLCTMSQLAFYFFYRWTISSESPPHFQRRQQWYDIHVLRGRNVTSPLSYEVQLEWTNKIYQVANVKILKKTHQRPYGAQRAELGGVSESQIRRAGRWNSDALSQSYLTHLPLEFVRVMAGFKPAPGDFYIARAKVQPSSSLVRSIWPWVDQWQAWFDQHLGESSLEPSVYEGLLIKDLPIAEEDRSDLAAQGFLRLLNELRTIILQDSVLLRREFPHHPMWKDSLFVREDYLRFSIEVENSLVDVTEPDELRIQRIVPDIANRLNMSRADIVRSINEHGARNHRLLEAIHERLEDFFAGKVSVTFHAPETSSSSPSRTRTMNAEAVNLFDSVTKGQASQLFTQSAHEATSSDEGSRNARTLDPNASPLIHTMSRTINTVPDLWREWMFGLGSAPAIQALETAYGARWRPSQQERVFFGRRKMIIEEVQRRTALGMTSEAAVEELELVRRRMNVGLHKLWKWLHDTKV